MTLEAKVNFFCPENRASFLLRPCEGFWAKIAEAREKWPNHQFNFPLNKCEGCKGDKLISPDQEEKAVAEIEKGQMVRTRILEAMDRLIPTVGPSVAKKDLATVLNIPVANLAFHLAKLHNSGLVKVTSPGDGFPDQISWPTPKDAPLPDKAVDVIQRCEKAGIVQEVELLAPYDDEVVVTRKSPSDIVRARPEILAQRIAEGKVPAPEVPEVRLCKNGDGRPAHKLSPYCLECCQENLKKNQERGKGKPKIDPAAIIAHREETFKIILAKFPVWDPNWSTALTEKWWEIFNKLWDMARELDGVGQ